MTTDQKAALCTCLEARLCRSTVEIRSHMASEFRLGYSHSGCIKCLARLGFEYRKRIRERTIEGLNAARKKANEKPQTPREARAYMKT